MLRASLNTPMPKTNRARSFEESRQTLITDVIRLTRMIREEKMTAETLSPEDYARMIRLRELLEDILEP